jgi:hypothetical protein
MKMEQTECSETSAYKIKTLRNYPEGSIQHSEHGESLKSRTFCLCTALKAEITYCNSGTSNYIYDSVESVELWSHGGK